MCSYGLRHGLGDVGLPFLQPLRFDEVPLSASTMHNRVGRRLYGHEDPIGFKYRREHYPLASECECRRRHNLRLTICPLVLRSPEHSPHSNGRESKRGALAIRGLFDLVQMPVSKSHHN
eukprot:3584252-Amphidinium_carterae.2